MLTLIPKPDPEYHRTREDVAMVEQRSNGLLIRRKNSYSPRWEAIHKNGSSVQVRTLTDALEFLAQ